MGDNQSSAPRMLTQLIIVAAVMLLVMTLYEWLKQFFIPEISIWGSHLITIIFTTLLAVATYYFILKQFHLQYAQRLQEIAQRKATEAALRQTELKCHGLVNNAMVGVYQVAQDGRFIMVNNKLAGIFGYDGASRFLKAVTNISQLYMRAEERTAIIDQISANGFIDRIEVEFKDRVSKSVWILLSARAYQEPAGGWVYEGFMIDITDRKQMEAEKERLLKDLEKSMSQVKLLSGMLPICASCKKIRDDHGYWNQIEAYIQSHSEAQFSHGCCPDCARKLYPRFIKSK